MDFTHVLLFTNQVENLQTFYKKTLGLEIKNETADSFQCKIGKTILEFKFHPAPRYYHFAINIPSNQAIPAYQWLQERTRIIPFQEEEIVQFKSWNAEAIYFKDPAGNILELIARKNLKINSETPFNISSFINISEVGVPVKSVIEVFENLHEKAKLDIYSGDLERFCAVGNENGLFILINPEAKKWIPDMDEAHFFPLQATFKNPNKKSFTVLLDENGWFKFV